MAHKTKPNRGDRAKTTKDKVKRMRKPTIKVNKNPGKNK